VGVAVEIAGEADDLAEEGMHRVCLGGWLWEAGVLADECRAGRIIRELAVDTGYSIARVRSLLERADVNKRQRGRTPRSVLEKA
jgi:hypothetical protein